MKVLQINAVSGIGSTGRTSVELADFLNSNGHEGYIAYSSGFIYRKGYKIGSWFDAKIHGLLSRIWGQQAYYSLNATKKLLNHINVEKPDIVHLRNLHANFINLNILLNYLAVMDIPTVITLHDCWFYTGKCTHYTLDGCYKWQTNCGGCPRLKKDNPSWFFDRTRKMHQEKKNWFGKIPRLAVVGVSDWITNEAKGSFLSSASIIRRIYNWIDLSVFTPKDTLWLKKKYDLCETYVVLGVSSRWSNNKGFKIFLDLADNIPPDIKIILVGKIDSNVSLPKNIIHFGETHSALELANYYSLADVYLHLSKEETFGKTIAEAISCGTPAIVPNATACPEVLGPECGIVINDTDIESIIKALEKIRKEGKNYYSNSCINHANKYFNKSHLIEEYIALYEELISL